MNNLFGKALLGLIAACILATPFVVVALSKPHPNIVIDKQGTVETVQPTKVPLPTITSKAKTKDYSKQWSTFCVQIKSDVSKYGASQTLGHYSATQATNIKKVCKI